MLVMLRGKTALSEFRVEALLARIRAEAPELGVAEVRTSYLYFIDTDESLTDATRERAMALLDADCGVQVDDLEGFVVAPRAGTISPWSSKATDIFTNCGLSQVKRVERGIMMVVVGAAGVLSPDQLKGVSAIIHDRMTEGLYLDMSGLFDVGEPAPFKDVDLLSGGRDALAEANREWGLALSEDEIDYLYESYSLSQRNPTDVELLMFG